MDLFISIINLYISLLFNLMHYFNIGDQPGFCNYFYSYWFLFLIYGIILVLYDLLINFLRFDIIGKLYFKWRCYSGLRFMTIIAEIYYILDKIMQKLSLGIVRYDFQIYNTFRKYKKSGFISLLDFLKYIFIKMFVIDRYNILIWITMLTYFKSGLLMFFYYNFKTINIETFFNFLTNVNLNNIFDQISGFWGLILTIVSGYGIFINMSKKMNDENIKKVIEYQEKLEEHFLNIVNLSEKNIDVLGLQVEHFPNYYCWWVTGSTKYLIQDRKLVSTKHYNRSDIISIKTIVDNYHSYSDDIKMIVEILVKIKNEGLTEAFNLINKHVKYEVVRLGLYDSKSFERLGNELLQKEYIQEFIENWSDESYLKERFKQFTEVWTGYKSKNLFEREHSSAYELNFEKNVEYAERELEKRALEFWNMSKYILSDAIECHIIAERYLKKNYNRRKIKGFLLKLDAIVSK